MTDRGDYSAQLIQTIRLAVTAGALMAIISSVALAGWVVWTLLTS